MQRNFAFIFIFLVPFLSGTCIAGRLAQQMSMADGPFMGHTRELTQCDSSSEACKSVCSCGACGYTCNNIKDFKIIPDDMPNLELPGGVKLFDNSRLTDALASMCADNFPAFSQADLAGGDRLTESSYAKGFAPACDQFTDAISKQPEETYFLAIGLPIGSLTLGGVSICLAVRPGCGDGDLQILAGLSDAKVTIPVVPQIALEPIYFGFSKKGSLNSASSSKLWSIDIERLAKGELDTQDMPSHISLRGSISAGIMLGSKLEIGLTAQITMGINLDTDNNGFGGKDFGLLFDVSAAPSILLKSPSGSPIFKMGGQGGGITATATIYHWKQGERRRLKVALTASVSFKTLIEKMEINGKPMNEGAITTVSGLFNIEANVALYLDLAYPKWGAYLYGDFSIDFQLPATVINFINDRGWGDVVRSLPYLGPIFKDGWRYSISGGVMVQDAQDYKDTTKLHIGFVNRNDVTWLDFSLCEQDSECYDYQCCAFGFFCIPKSSSLCGSVMTAITNGITEIKRTLVQFTNFVGRTAENIWKAASTGVYNFFKSVFGSDPGSNDYWAWKYWNLDNNPANDEYFIRVATYELTDNTVGIGIDRPGCDTCWISLNEGWRLQAKRKQNGNYAAWWYIQKGGGGPDEHLVFKSYKNRDYCWDVPGRRFEEGTNLQIWKCNGTPAQQFVIVPFGKDNKGWMSIRPKSAFWLCFDLDPKVGDYVVLKKCQETGSQRFAISNK